MLTSAEMPTAMNYSFFERGHNAGEPRVAVRVQATVLASEMPQVIERAIAGSGWPSSSYTMRSVGSLRWAASAPRSSVESCEDRRCRFADRREADAQIVVARIEMRGECEETFRLRAFPARHVAQARIVGAR